MKKLISSLIISLLLVGHAFAGEYVGSKLRHIYHYTTCQWAKKIHPENLVTFNSVQEAKKQGYRPCHVCKPPN